MSELPSLFVMPLIGEPVLFVHDPLTSKKPAEDQGIWVRDVRTDENSGALARQFLDEHNFARAGIVGQREMWTSMYLGLTSSPGRLQFEAADYLVNRERMIKEPEEIELHRTAAKIADAMFYASMNAARVHGTWAYELMLEMERMGRRMGADLARCWLDTGPAPEFIYEQTWQLRRQLQEGDRVHAGNYVVYEGYWSHELRMGIKGKPSAELKHYFDLVLDVQEAGLEGLKPGRTLRDVGMTMDKLIDQYSPYAIEDDPCRFRPGHGMGLEYGDPIVSDAFPYPWQRRREMASGADSGRAQDSVLVQPGMVVELHPNFNVPGLGMVFVGDVVLVTETGAERLTSFPRELYLI